MPRSVGAQGAETAHAAELGQTAVRHLWHHITQVAEYADVGPMLLVEGQGALVRDIAGREYIDGTSIMGVTMVGHGRAEIADAIAAQARRLEYASLTNGFSNVPATELARLLADRAPGRLEVSFFACSGSEAVEAAIKIARQCQAQRGFPRRTKIIARRGSYHGVTLGALSATGLPGFRAPFEPLLPGFVHIAQPYVYRCDTELGCRPDEVGAAAAAALERQILFEAPETVAAFIAEPVAIPQAIKVPPADYWPQIQQICRKYGVLLIVDEVFNGFGRTGRWFGADHWSIEPDLMTVSKGLTSGYVPLSAAMATREVFHAFWGEASKALQHGGTYSGHPVACAAALANLAILERERLPDNAARVGKRLLDGLRELADRPFVGDVSGIGLLTSIELVADKRTKRPAPSEVGRFLRDRMRELGLLGRYTPETIYFFPPLVIDEEQTETIVSIFRTALDDAAKQFPVR